MDNHYVCNTLFPRQIKLTDLHFFVRDDRVVDQIESNLEVIKSNRRGEDLLIIGDGGSGKSSLLSYTEEWCNQHNIFSVTWPLGARVEGHSPGDFFRVLTKKIVYTVQEIHQKPGFRKGQELLNNITKWGLTFGPGTIEGRVPSRHEINDRWLDYLSTNGPRDFMELAEDVNRVTETYGFLIMLDDADLIPKAVFEFFRDIFPDDGIITLFVASGVRPYSGETESLRDYNNRLLRPFLEIEIYPFEEHQIERLIEKRLQTSLDDYYLDDYYMEPEHKHYIAQLSKGNPFVAYQLARNCCRYGLKGNKLRLTQNVIDRSYGVWGFTNDPNIYDLLEPR